MRVLWLALLAGCAVEEAGIEVNPAEVTTDNGTYELHLTPSSNPYVTGEDVSLDVHVHGDHTDALSLEVTPWMPEHNHGISGDPTIEEGTMDGMFTANWAFSMPGYWELTLEVDGNDGADSVIVAYEVE